MNSSDSSDPVQDARLAELRGRFKATLPARIATVSDCSSALQPGAISRAATEDLLTHVHSIAGAAGLFGFSPVGEAAAAVERIVVRLRSSEQLSPADLESLRDAVAQLRTVARG